MKKKSRVLPRFIKQKAKQLKRENPLKTHTQALNEIAQQLGFSNYKHYRNDSETNRKSRKFSIETLLKNISSENDISKKMELAISFMQKFEIPFHEQLDIIKLFQYPDDSKDIRSICEKLNFMKSEIQTYLLKDFLTKESKEEIYFRMPYFIAKEVSVSELTYEIEDDTLLVDGQYNLKTEFEFELDENDPISKDDRFKDRELCGSFGITIDRNKKITIEHSDMSIDNGFNIMHGFTKEELEEYYERFPHERGQFDDILVLDD